MDLISVIVPVYNAEKYLDRCVQSIVDQTYKNLEIILVDDGSPDNCGAMCDTWAAKDNRIKVIHKENGGVSSARNAGLDSAVGDFVCFVDSDDWVAPIFAERMLSAAKHWDVPIVICKMQLVSEITNFQNVEVKKYIEQEITNKAAMSDLVTGGIVQGGACDKLYRRDILENVRFPLGRRHEDEFFTHEIVNKAECLAFIDVELYYYFQQENSFMHSVTISHLDMLDALLERLHLLEKKYPDLYRTGKALFCASCIGYCRMVLQWKPSDKDPYIAKIKNCRNKIKFTLTELISYAPKELLYVLGSKSCPVVIAKILNYLKGE